jgi:hypothetical protein
MDVHMEKELEDWVLRYHAERQSVSRNDIAIKAKVRQRLHVMRRSRYNVNYDGKMLLFNALAMPYFTYGIELWFSSSKALRASVELLFRHCLRTVVNDVNRIPSLSNIELYVKLNVIPLSLVFQLKLGQVMHEAMKKNTTMRYIRDMFQTAVESVGDQDAYLRNRLPLKLPLVRLEVSRAGLGFYGAYLWNHLPPNIRNIENTSIFADRYTNELMVLLKKNGQSLDFCPTKFYEFVKIA